MLTTSRTHQKMWPITLTVFATLTIWLGSKGYLFYVCRTEQDASFDEDIRHEVTMSHFHGFRTFEERGHHYEL